ncbi:MAG: class I SAM-dependent methyltransferase [Alphaproteobacteria bacterium]
MSEKNTVVNHYDTVAASYHEQYDRDMLYDVTKVYPANYFRLQMLLNSFVTKNIKKVVEIGVGEGTPLVTLGKAGIDIWGFDVSKEMVKKSQENMIKSGQDPDHIFLADIQDSTSYVHCLKDGLFDGLIAMGVLPHVQNDDLVLENMASMVKKGGSVFIEFRNKLFSLFSQNRHTVDFIMNDLLGDVSDEMKQYVEEDLKSRLRTDMPKIRDKVQGTDKPGYDAILSKFHNPFEVIELFKKHNFKDIKLLWYHYHPAMPYLSEKDPELFRREAIKLEHEPSNWRGLFLCSAFVIEAVKK